MMRAIVAGLVTGVLLIGCGGGPAGDAMEGSRKLSGVHGSVTAREAFALVYPVALQVSENPVMVLITSGPRIDGEGRSDGWEFVFHFPDRNAQAVYTLEPVDPERSDGGLRLRWRISPRQHLKRADEGLPLDFIDSPDAARELTRMGADWVAGDPDMTLVATRHSSGESVWTAESSGKQLTTPFTAPAH